MATSSTQDDCQLIGGERAEEMKGSPPIAKAVTIDGKRYRVAGMVFSQSRGREYQCANEDGLIVRVCHAPGHKVTAALTPEYVEYHWEEGERDD